MKLLRFQNAGTGETWVLPPTSLLYVFGVPEPPDMPRYEAQATCSIGIAGHPVSVLVEGSLDTIIRMWIEATG